LYIKDPKAQRLLAKLRNGKKLKEIKLVDGLLKYKQIQVHVPQWKLKLLVLKEDRHIYRGEKTTIAAISRRYYWLGIKEEVAHFVKICVKCQLN
jgi:hypothetical protein